MNKTQYCLKMILLQAFIDEKWKKRQKNRTESTEWDCDSMVTSYSWFCFKLLHVVGLVVVDDNDSCLFTIFYTEKFQLHIHNSDSSSSNSKYWV